MTCDKQVDGRGRSWDLFLPALSLAPKLGKETNGTRMTQQESRLLSFIRLQVNAVHLFIVSFLCANSRRDSNENKTQFQFSKSSQSPAEGDRRSAWLQKSKQWLTSKSINIITTEVGEILNENLESFVFISNLGSLVSARTGPPCSHHTGHFLLPSCLYSAPFLFPKFYSPLLHLPFHHLCLRKIQWIYKERKPQY